MFIRGSIVYEPLNPLPNYIPPRASPPSPPKMNGKYSLPPLTMSPLVEPNVTGSFDHGTTGLKKSASIDGIFKRKPVDPAEYFAQFKVPSYLKTYEPPVPLFTIVRRSESLNARRTESRRNEDIPKLANNLWSNDTADDVVYRILTGGGWGRDELPPPAPRVQRPKNGQNRHLWHKEESSQGVIRGVRKFAEPMGYDHQSRRLD